MKGWKLMIVPDEIRADGCNYAGHVDAGERLVLDCIHPAHSFGLTIRCVVKNGGRGGVVRLRLSGLSGGFRGDGRKICEGSWLVRYEFSGDKK